LTAGACRRIQLHKENAVGSIKKKRRKKMAKHKYRKRQRADRHKNK